MIRLCAVLLMLAALFGVMPAAWSGTPLGLDTDGWTPREASADTTYFQCGIPACGGQAALVSVRRREHMPAMTLGWFEATQQQTNQRILATIANIRTSHVGQPQETRSRDVRIFTATLDYADGEGRAKFFSIALLVGPRATLSLTSSAASAQQAQANYDAFVPRLVDLLMKE